jgi:phage-related protein
MKGITFGNLHSYNDLKLILESKEIGSPEVKIRKIDIEGADSSLDLTDFFGEPKYEDVTHKFTFSTIVPQAQFLSLFSTVKNALHGKKMRIILDDDPLFFYMGRIKVSSFTNEKNIGKISVECDCEPYKYKLAKTVVKATVDGTQAVSLTNGRKRAVPEVRIETEGSIRIEFQGSNIWDLGSGSYTLPELELTEGVNTVTVTGIGTITFTWQEANL